MRWNRHVPGIFDDRGFTIVEASIYALLIMVVAGFALVNIRGILPRMQANEALAQTVAQLRSGREQAIAQRRIVELRFLGTNEIRLIRYDQPAGTTVLSTVTLDNRIEFARFGGIPDTPDAFGASAAVDFNGRAPLYFQSDGTLADALGSPVSGSIFMGELGHPETARAVTILGATGRVRGYVWTGNAWVH